MNGNGFAGLLLLSAAFFLPASAMAVSAVAVDQAAHKFGYCHSKPTLEAAKQCAVSACERSGARNCRITDTGTKGGYSAIAAGSGQLGVFLASHEGEDMVSARAMWDCVKKATGCDYADVQSGQCNIKTSCKIVAKWKEPEQAGQSQSARTGEHQLPQPAQPGGHRPEARQPNVPSPAAVQANVVPSGGYQTCNIPSDRIAKNGSVERPRDAAYNQVCLSILPPTCRNWVVDKKPCAYRPCVVDENLAHCPNGEPTAYVAKQVLPFTKEDFAAMDAQIAAEASRIAAQRGGNPAPGAAANSQYWQTQIQHRQTERFNGNAGGVTYNGR